MDRYLGDLRFGLRQLRLNPTFTAVAVLSLALGIGANTAIFQLIDAIRLRALPVGNPQELAYIDFAKDSKRSGWWSTRSANLHVRAMGQRSHASGGVFRNDGLERERSSISPRKERRDTRKGLFVSGDFFNVLRVPAAVGPDVHGGGRPAGLRVAGRRDQLLVLAG